MEGYALIMPKRFEKSRRTRISDQFVSEIGKSPAVVCFCNPLVRSQKSTRKPIHDKDSRALLFVIDCAGFLPVQPEATGMVLPGNSPSANVMGQTKKLPRVDTRGSFSMNNSMS